MSINPAARETVKRHYRVERREIAFFKFIFEAYDGLAVVETLDPAAGLLALHIAPGCEPDVEMILANLKQDVLMEEQQTPIE